MLRVRAAVRAGRVRASFHVYSTDADVYARTECPHRMNHRERRQSGALLEPPAVAGVDLMRARFRRHEFRRHSHETFAIGVTEVGAEDLGFGADVVVPGGLILINPGEVHTGRAAADGE